MRRSVFLQFLLVSLDATSAAEIISVVFTRGERVGL
jgi:hypothetical protein